MSANKCSIIVELLLWCAQNEPDRAVLIFLLDGECVTKTLSYQALDQQARAIAARLQNLTRPSDRALLLYPPRTAVHISHCSLSKP